MSDHHPTIIVGAGLAGLACARTLHTAGRPFILVEATDRVGGRVRTDVIEHEHGRYLLDRGFQVYLTSYPEGRRWLEYEALKLGGFKPGAMVRAGERWTRFADPFRDPIRGLGVAASDLVSFGDLVRLGLFDLSSRFASSDAAWASREETAEAMLRRLRLSERLIDGFFRPFFGGVFLDRSLQTSARMLRFTYANFARGRATLPAEGMGAIPAQIAATLPADSVRLGSRVSAVDRGERPSVVLESGERIDGDALVIAAEGPAARGLVPDLVTTADNWRATTTIWFDAPAPPIVEPLLALDGDGDGPVNHLAVVSNAQPSYAPQGRALIAASAVHGTGPVPDESELFERVTEQMFRWFGEPVRAWHRLRTDTIRHALPNESSPAFERPSRMIVQGPVIVCGDHTENASINGALLSGRRAAEAILGGPAPA